MLITNYGREKICGKQSMISEGKANNLSEIRKAHCFGKMHLKCHSRTGSNFDMKKDNL